MPLLKHYLSPPCYKMGQHVEQEPQTKRPDVESVQHSAIRQRDIQFTLSAAY